MVLPNLSVDDDRNATSLGRRWTNESGKKARRECGVVVEIAAKLRAHFALFGNRQAPMPIANGRGFEDTEREHDESLILQMSISGRHS